VILATCVGAGNRLLKEHMFDYVVIDEAAQGLEACCWIPMLRAEPHGGVCVLAGDHLQLPPTIKSKHAEINGLGVTLFERLIQDPNDRFGPFCRLLNTQYRMNALISNWASKQLYAGKLVSHDSVAAHSLSDLIHGKSAAALATSTTAAAITIPVLLLLDTAGCDMDESSCLGGSHRNDYEADIVYRHVCMLVRCGISPTDIGVITPYNGQLDLLKQALLNRNAAEEASGGSQSRDENAVDLEGVEIRTIDGFQGGEKECIILSLVRSNSRHEVGFLGDNRRINVAVTRAKRHLCVVCDSATCGSDRFINTLVTHLSANGEHRCMQEYGVLDTPELWFSGDDGYSAEVPGDEAGETGTSAAVDGSANTVRPKKTDKSASAPQRKKPAVAPQVGNKKPHSLSSSTALKAGDVGDAARPQTLVSEIEATLGDFASGAIQGGILRVAGETLVIIEPIDLNTSVNSLPSGKAFARRLLRFPTTLSSYHRKVIHDVATTLGLQHRSLGSKVEGNNRFIEVATTLEAFCLCDCSPIYSFTLTQPSATIVSQQAAATEPRNEADGEAGSEHFGTANDFSVLGSNDDDKDDEENNEDPTAAGGAAEVTESKKKKKKKSKSQQEAAKEQQRQQQLQHEAEKPKFYVSEERKKAMNAIATASKKGNSEMEAVEAAIAANEV
jgi:hypothetical protein